MVILRLLTSFQIILCVVICVNYEEETVCDILKLVITELAKVFVYNERVDNEDLYNDVENNYIADFGEFDYIVVGAGTAGSVVANKLADCNTNVLLLEAGDCETDFTDIPAMFRQLQFSKHNWGYYTTPQTNCCQGMINKQCAFPRGKVMGGTSTIGGLTYARGNQRDQDTWSEFHIEGWTWKDVLPYYKEIENYDQITDLPEDAHKYHGFDGPIPIDYARPVNQLQDIFLFANGEVYETTDDLNGPNNMAAGKVQFMKKKGRRISSAKAYLKPTPEYVTISKFSYVYKILINDFSDATGVLFTKKGKHFKANAKLEIIICAGSVNTPQILMLSGIGPKDELKKHNIPLIADLPVGKNLVGHIGFHGLQVKSDLKLYDRNETILQHIDDYQSGVGALANVAIDGISFTSTSNDKTFPNLEVFVASRGELNITTRNEWNFDEVTLKKFTPPKADLEYIFRIAILVIKAESKGTVTLKSSSPKDFPVIDTNSLSDPRDIDAIYKGVDYVMKLLKSKSFAQINAKLLKRVLPACEKFTYLSKDYWYCMIKHMSGTANHPVGTCRMGEQLDGVVDSKLRVKGVGSLRIADLSVAPRVNSLHTNALALVIGARAADFIKNFEWNKNKKFSSG